MFSKLLILSILAVGLRGQEPVPDEPDEPWNPPPMVYREYTVRLRAKNLPMKKMYDVCVEDPALMEVARPNTLVRVSYSETFNKNEEEEFRSLGETKTVRCNQNPDWRPRANTLAVQPMPPMPPPYPPGTTEPEEPNRRMKFEIFEEHVWDYEDQIGTVFLNIFEYQNSTAGKYKIEADIKKPWDDETVYGKLFIDLLIKETIMG